jgi:plasmid maintenance system antidote protein VapI
MDQPNAQVLFFQQIKALLPPQLSVADEIARVLEISTDSAYRRIRGEKPISFEDTCKLCASYNISLESFLQLQNNNFVFTGNLGYNSQDFVAQYLNNMAQQFEFMRGFDHKHIYFLPNDIPPFAYFQFPELAAFTFFFYKKSLLHLDEMKDLKFSAGHLNEDHVRLGKKVQESFNSIPSTEIWSIDTINSILRHISFYRDTQVFESKEDMICMYNQLEALIAHIEKQAELGRKFSIGKMPDKNSGAYRMFHNDLITGDNCVLAEVGNNKVTYINHNLINFMYTRNENFNAHTFNTFQNAIRKSTQISEVGEKDRAKFFSRLKMKIRSHKDTNGI